MELFRKKLKVRIILLCTLLPAFVAILVYNQFGAPIELRESLAFSFQCGFSAAGSLVLIFWLAKYRAALQSEAKLHRLSNQENDERMSAIRAKAGLPMVLFLSLALVLGGMIIGYFNETAFIVLITAALFELMVSLGAKLYYKMKM